MASTSWINVKREEARESKERTANGGKSPREPSDSATRKITQPGQHRRPDLETIQD